MTPSLLLLLPAVASAIGLPIMHSPPKDLIVGGVLIAFMTGFAVPAVTAFIG